MSSYSYDSGGRNRSTEKVMWLVMALMVSFVLLSTFHPGVNAWLSKSQGAFGLGLLLVYVTFLLASRRNFRRQRMANIHISTTRRNFTYKDHGGEKIYSWRDVREADMRVEVDRQGQAYVAKMTLNVPKARVSLENHPMVPLPRMVRLVEEVRQKVGGSVRWHFHWFHPICPLCKTALLPRSEKCPGCGERVKYVSKMRRPWELIREENLYVLLILLYAFYPLALPFLASIALVALVRNTPSRLRPLETEEEPASSLEESPPEVGNDDGVERKATNSAPLLLMILAAVLLASPVHAAPSPAGGASPVPDVPSPVPSSPLPTASPAQADAKADASYFPLAVGNTWEYRSSFDRVVMKVTGQEIVNGAACYVVESFVGDGTDSVQKEYYAVTAAGVEVYKRSHKGSDFFLDTPEQMLAFPLREGRHWTWQGNAAQGTVMLAFEIKGERRVPVLGREMSALLVLIRGRSADGSEIQTKRWYCRGIGMVREQSMMKKAGKATSMDASLQNYSLRVGQPTGD